MGRIITGYLPAGGFLGPMFVSHPRSACASREQRGSGQKTPAGRKTEGLTAYEVAVLLAIGAAILSCL
jgi:hypothetical protein